MIRMSNSDPPLEERCRLCELVAAVWLTSCMLGLCAYIILEFA